MSSSTLSNELRRFISRIVSIPHLETMLLLQQAPEQVWNVSSVAQRIYVSQTQAAIMLKDLCEAGICKSIVDSPGEFIYSPINLGLGTLINELAEYYPRNLIQVTNMVHAKSASRRAQMFADAFKLNKDK